MKKIILLCICFLLIGCGTPSLSQEIPPNKFEGQKEVKAFDIDGYIESIDAMISDIDFIRIDSVFLDEEDRASIDMTPEVIENILNIYSVYEKDHASFEVINFYDLHIQKLESIDIDILTKKLIDKIEDDFYLYDDVVRQQIFYDITKDYNSRITQSFIKNYEVSDELRSKYPEMDDYLISLNKIVEGGYQIRKFKNEYFIFTDYASFLSRYDDYFSEETNAFVDILVSSSRNLLRAGNYILMDNEDIAYQVNKMEAFMKRYPSSLNYARVRDIYQRYMMTMVTNPGNVLINDNVQLKYKATVINDFEGIVDRYSNTQMSRILLLLVRNIEEEDGLYNQSIVDELIEIIVDSY